MSNPALLIAAIPSEDTLNQVYGSLVSSGVQSTIYRFLKDPGDSARYSDMIVAIPLWLNSNTTRNSIGVTNGGDMKNLRINIALSDGLVVYDSASTRNIFTNIGIPDENFVSNGKYKINENHGNRNYVMAASLSRSGKAYAVKFSTSTKKRQFYIAVRQNTDIDNYGVISISMAP